MVVVAVTIFSKYPVEVFPFVLSVNANPLVDGPGDSLHSLAFTAPTNTSLGEVVVMGPVVDAPPAEGMVPVAVAVTSKVNAALYSAQIALAYSPVWGPERVTVNPAAALETLGANQISTFNQPSALRSETSLLHTAPVSLIPVTVGERDGLSTLVTYVPITQTKLSPVVGVNVNVNGIVVDVFDGGSVEPCACTRLRAFTDGNVPPTASRQLMLSRIRMIAAFLSAISFLDILPRLYFQCDKSIRVLFFSFPIANH